MTHDNVVSFSHLSFHKICSYIGTHLKIAIFLILVIIAKVFQHRFLLLVYLRTSPEKCMERIKKRSRDEETSVSMVCTCM